MPRVSELNHKYPLGCAVLRQIRSEYADWLYDDCRGYIQYYKSGESHKPYEHRLVAIAAHDGIPEGHHVHHLGETFDNRASMLQVVSPEEHHRIHYGAPFRVTCDRCGKTFNRRKSHAERNRNSVYCSRRCRGLDSRKVKRPSAGELFHLMRTVSNWTALGEMFGVSDNAVRKWAKRYNLDLSVCDGRRRA